MQSIEYLRHSEYLGEFHSPFIYRVDITEYFCMKQSHKYHNKPFEGFGKQNSVIKSLIQTSLNFIEKIRQSLKPTIAQ